jgi:hypothetical protein
MGVLPLDYGRRIAEDAMSDRCRIVSDRQAQRDDTLDRTTGRLTPPAGDETTVYEGICGPTVETPLDARREEGGRTAHYRAWRTRIPMSAPLPDRNDVVLILACESDPTLVGRRLRITDVNQSSIGVTRRLALEDETAPTVE